MLWGDEVGEWGEWGFKDMSGGNSLLVGILVGCFVCIYFLVGDVEGRTTNNRDVKET